MAHLPEGHVTHVVIHLPRPHVLRLGIRVVLQALQVDEIADLVHGRLMPLELVVVLVHRLPRGLAAGLGEPLEVAIRQRLLRRGALRWVKGQQALHDPQRRRVDLGEVPLQGHARLGLHRLQEAPSLLIAHLGDDCGGRRPDEVSDELELVDHVAAWEEGLPLEELREDASDGPDVNGGGVLGKERTAELRGAVPARGHVIGPEHRLRHVIEGRAGEAKVADLQLAVGVGQDVLRLEVAVKHVGRVDVLQTTEQLVEEELIVLCCEVIVCLDHLMQVGLHKLEHHVNILVALGVVRQHDVPQLDDVGMPEVAEQLDLAQDTRRIRDVLEDIRDFLNGYFLPVRVVDGRANDTI
mmetsp:Transcript_13085/g.41375  ORF Transcript_13085/g.41375 Transcript_13085/m.41375 type:complete len:353 (-) Transcript_13085:435-1493(-)